MEAVLYQSLNLLPTFGLIFIICLMLYILSKGADLLVDEAVKLSLRWGVSKMIIGATIVSLGTTLPEASVSVLAALNGNPDLALGNAIGSIIADTGLIIGIAAIIGHLPVDQVVVKRQGKIQVGAGVLLAIVSLPFLSSGNGNISQWMGWLFLILLILYIYKSIKWSKDSNAHQNNESLSLENEAAITEGVFQQEKNAIIHLILKLFLGIFLVIASSKILIPTVEISAIRVGIPQSVIAATLIAFGTSLPELVTAITAVRKGHGELAIGNIVGADILNVLFVVGSAAAVTSGGLDVPLNFYKLQIPTMVIILITFRLFSKDSKNEEITKKEGLILLTMYLIYLILNYIWI